MVSHDEKCSERPIILSDYHEDWPRRFHLERARLESHLQDPVVELEHFGSTAVPGMPAKPIIDMMASVASLQKGRDASVPLYELDYAPAKTDFTRRVLLRRDDKEVGCTFHLHLVVCPTWPIKNELLFRDWLIENPEDAAAYAALKRQLARACEGDLSHYTKGKSDFIRGVVRKSRAALGLPAEKDWSE